MQYRTNKVWIVMFNNSNNSGKLHGKDIYTNNILCKLEDANAPREVKLVGFLRVHWWPLGLLSDSIKDHIKKSLKSVSFLQELKEKYRDEFDFIQNDIIKLK